MTTNIKNFIDRLDNDLCPIKEQAFKYYDIDSKVREDNAVQIFKQVWIAPQSFGLVLFPPADKNWISKFEKETGKLMPKKLHITGGLAQADDSAVDNYREFETENEL